ncbi:MAG TPA: 50S ribosomal protein L11 methyltransferase [Solirubrobacteraceae bacterium]
MRVGRADAELVLAELLELAPSGVEETELAGNVIEYAVYGAPGELPELPDLRAAAGDALVEVSTSEIADDWGERWRDFHRPLVLDGQLTVRPPWTPPAETPLDLVIDPGQAFGTGAHATTRLCLELMLALDDRRGPLLDLGCGSGVLAIAAVKLGWDPVEALDNDPASVVAAGENAERNRVRLAVRRHDLRSDPVPVAETVTANLLGPLLRSVAGRLLDQVQRPRALIASGLLQAEADGIAAAFGEAGLHERDRRTRGEWAALLLTRDPHG